MSTGILLPVCRGHSVMMYKEGFDIVDRWQGTINRVVFNNPAYENFLEKLKRLDLAKKILESGTLFLIPVATIPIYFVFSAPILALSVAGGIICGVVALGVLCLALRRFEAFYTQKHLQENPNFQDAIVTSCFHYYKLFEFTPERLQNWMMRSSQNSYNFIDSDRVELKQHLMSFSDEIKSQIFSSNPNLYLSLLDLDEARAELDRLMRHANRELLAPKVRKLLGDTINRSLVEKEKYFVDAYLSSLTVNERLDLLEFLLNNNYNPIGNIRIFELCARAFSLGKDDCSELVLKLVQRSNHNKLLVISLVAFKPSIITNRYVLDMVLEHAPHAITEDLLDCALDESRSFLEIRSRGDGWCLLRKRLLGFSQIRFITEFNRDGTMYKHALNRSNFYSSLFADDIASLEFGPAIFERPREGLFRLRPGVLAFLPAAWPYHNPRLDLSEEGFRKLQALYENEAFIRRRHLLASRAI